MRKIFLLILAVFIMFSFTGCNNHKSDNLLNNEITREIELYIKTVYLNRYNQYIEDSGRDPSDFIQSTIDDFVIKHYFGKYNGMYILALKDDIPLAQVIQYFYICLINNVPYKIKYLPEYISVIYKNNIFHLTEACKMG